MRLPLVSNIPLAPVPPARPCRAKLLYAQQEAHNKSLIGKTLSVLVEGKGRKGGQLFGRSPYLTGTHFDGPEDLVGTIVDVKIEEAGRNSLVGILA